MDEPTLIRAYEATNFVELSMPCATPTCQGRAFSPDLWCRDCEAAMLARIARLEEPDG